MSNLKNLFFLKQVYLGLKGVVTHEINNKFLMTMFILTDFRFNFEQKNTSNANYVLFDKVKSTRDFNLFHKYKRSHTQKVTNSMVVNSLTDIDWTLNGTRHICIIKLEVLRCFDVSICKIRLGNLSLLLWLYKLHVLHSSYILLYYCYY